MIPAAVGRGREVEVEGGVKVEMAHMLDDTLKLESQLERKIVPRIDWKEAPATTIPGTSIPGTVPAAEHHPPLAPRCDPLSAQVRTSKKLGAGATAEVPYHVWLSLFPAWLGVIVSADV